MKKLYAFILIPLLCWTCKKGPKADGPEPGGKDEGTQPALSIRKTTLKPGELILYPSAALLILKKNEETSIDIKQLTAVVADSIPKTITYSSSDPAVATFAEGKVKAIGNGSCILTASVNGVTKTNSQVVVQASDLPALDQPVSAQFHRPFFALNRAEDNPIAVTPLNRLGMKLEKALKLSVSEKEIQKEIDGKQIKADQLPEGGYTVKAKYGELELEGAATMVVYQPESKLFTDSVPKVYAVHLDWGRYPRYFSKKGITSDPVRGLVYRAALQKINGVDQLTISTSEEDLTVETEEGGVLSASGKTLTSVKEGLGRWRVVAGNFFSSWYTSQVFVDFSGGWYCENDRQGHDIRMNVPQVPDIVFHGGVLGNQHHINKTFVLNSRFPAYAHTTRAKSLVTDLVNKESFSNLDVEIGPATECLICSTPTRVQRSGWGSGGISFVNNNVYGGITYISENEFTVFDQNKNEFRFKRAEVSTEPPVQMTISSFSPESAPEGTRVTIYGKLFKDVLEVSFGGVKAKSFNLVSSTEISATVANGASGAVVVKTKTKTLSSPGFIFMPPPVCDKTVGKVEEGNVVNLKNYWRGVTKFENFTVTSSSVNPSYDRPCEYRLEAEPITIGDNRVPITVTLSEKPAKSKTFKIVESNWLSPLQAGTAKIAFEYYFYSISGGTVNVTVSGGKVSVSVQNAELHSSKFGWDGVPLFLDMSWNGK
ncbi:MAG TPA: hypothetical protein VKB19_01950 [Pedobacter sp.]|nr:hypothetical protein [Pedobacter sp.]